jgi:hypothetical protein
VNNVTSEKFLHSVQIRTARIAASASATRNQGEGAASAAREFLAAIDLRQFAVSSGSVLRARLDETTESLLRVLPRQARNWGLARKLINIFLRDALYTTYLCQHYALTKAESWLEIPLDSITAGRLREDAGPRVLPRWRGVKHVTPEANDRYQHHAEKIALGVGVARVHLDTDWWGVRS